MPQLRAAAPHVWVEMSTKYADALGVSEGDLVEISSARGVIHAAARISGIREGVLFVPFHYGYWDAADPDQHARAANELTITDWDPVSKQPMFKTAAVRARRIDAGEGTAVPAPTNTASRPVTAEVPNTRGGPAACDDEQMNITGGMR